MKRSLLQIVLLLALSGILFAQHEGHTMPASAPTQNSTKDSPPEVEKLRSELLKFQQAFESERQRGRKLNIEDAERSVERSPTFLQAVAASRAAIARANQAGRWTNPVVGYTGEEIRGGSFGGGQHGFFIEQDIPLGGRLRSASDAARADQRLAETGIGQQRAIARNRISLAFFAVLSDQEMLQARWQMAELAAENFATAMRLRNIGQLDLSEVLQAGIEAQRAKLAYLQQQDALRSSWAVLAANMSERVLPLGSVQGEWMQMSQDVDEAAMLAQLLENSPLVQSARANLTRAESTVAVARRSIIPDLRIRAGLQQNREIIDEPAKKRAGLQGLAEIGVQLPLFNRNQGGVQAAQAEVEAARAEQHRVELQLRQRFAEAAAMHRSAKIAAETYKNDILPSAELSYKMMRERWSQMTASYPLLLATQRSLAEARAEYVNALHDLKRSSIQLQGPLADDGFSLQLTGGERD